MIDLYKKSESTETSEELGNAIIQMIKDNLDPEEWNFELSFKDFSKMSYQKVIFDSPYCRISFSFSRQRLPKYDELSIYYGRLHAPNEGPFIVWKGEECRCWHHIWHPLYFLDGLSPSEAVHRADILNQLPFVAENFWSSEQGKNLRNEYSPLYVIVLQSVLWKHYGKRLFELLDLRQPKLWDEYRQFIKEYYRLLDRKTSYGPPYENVC